MFDTIDRLNQEIVNIQVLDNYLKDGLIRFDTYFMREDYKDEMKRLENFIKPYEEKEEIEDDDYFDEEYTLDDVLEELVADLDIYECLYKVPEISIENDEWEIFFETVGNFYIERELDGFFMDDMITLNRYAIARAMVYEEGTLSLNTYISSLNYIESDILTINNIVEIAQRLGEKFEIDALSLIANKDGGYGCVGKNLEVFIVDDEAQEQIDNEFMKQRLESYGYQIKETIDIIEDEELHLTDKNVVSLNNYKSKRKNKIGRD